MTSGWPYELFVRHGKLYYPFLKTLKAQAELEADFLCKIFDEFHVPRGCRILDLFCGIGRHAINLSKRGYEVVGYDPSSFFLRKARIWAKQEIRTKELVSFLRGTAEMPAKDLLKNDKKSFRVIMMLGSVLGYSSINHDLAILKDIRQLAGDKCLLITHTENRDWRIRNFQPDIVYRFEDLVVHEMWRLNPENSVFEGDSYYYKVAKKGKWLQLLLNLEISLRLYSLHEIIQILKNSDWNYLKSYGGFACGPAPSIESENLITVSEINYPNHG